MLPPLELQPCPRLDALTVLPSQLFYLKCQTCEEAGSRGCKIESYLYANECIGVKATSIAHGLEQCLLGLDQCEPKSSGDSQQVSRRVSVRIVLSLTLERDSRRLSLSSLPSRQEGNKKWR